MNRDDLLGTSFACACGKMHHVHTRTLIRERGALERTAAVVRSLELTGRAFVLADATTYEVAGRDVVRILEGDGLHVEVNILPEHPKADDRTLQVVRDAYRPSDMMVTCGSGTITDLGKKLAHERDVPLIAVATAPSMNGYASNIAALMYEGVKVAEPVRPALAVIADLDIMAHAPLEMIRAGLGDALSKSVSGADWKLAHLMRDSHFCDRAFELTRDLEPAYLEGAGAVGRRDPSAIAALTEALLYSGVSMVLAGSSAAVSGGEHLISHALDMRGAVVGREPALHGAQVGVATLITARIYDRLLSCSAADLAGIIAHYTGGSDEASVEKRVRNFFGPAADTIVAEHRAKEREGRQVEVDRRQLVSSWDAFRADVARFFKPSDTIERTLIAAGCKKRYAEMGLSGEEFKEALYLARTIRPRFTILDVAWELGMLTDFVEEVL